MLRPQRKQQAQDGLAVNAAGRGATNLVTLMSGHVLVLMVVAVSGTLVPRMLGVEAYGQFAAVLAGLAILRSMATGGLQQVGLHYLPPLCRGQDRSAAAVLGSSIWLVQLGLAMIAGVGAAVWLGPTLLVAQGSWMPLLLGVLGGAWIAQAATIAPSEAGPLAVAVHLASVPQGIFLAGRRALVPILAEMAAAGQPDRLRLWGGLMMRYGVAGMCLITVGWALVGEAATRLVFGETFLAVYASVSVMLLGTLCYCCGVSCTGLLYIRGLAGLASRAAVVRMVVTVAGLLLVVHSENPDKAYLACWVYTVTALCHWAEGYVVLGLRGGMWLPLRRTLLLMLPV